MNWSVYEHTPHTNLMARPSTRARPNGALSTGLSEKPRRVTVVHRESVTVAEEQPKADSVEESDAPVPTTQCDADISCHDAEPSLVESSRDIIAAVSNVHQKILDDRITYSRNLLGNVLIEEFDLFDTDPDQFDSKSPTWHVSITRTFLLCCFYLILLFRLLYCLSLQSDIITLIEQVSATKLAVGRQAWNNQINFVSRFAVGAIYVAIYKRIPSSRIKLNEEEKTVILSILRHIHFADTIEGDVIRKYPSPIEILSKGVNVGSFFASQRSRVSMFGTSRDSIGSSKGRTSKNGRTRIGLFEPYYSALRRLGCQFKKKADNQEAFLSGDDSETVMHGNI